MTTEQHAPVHDPSIRPVGSGRAPRRPPVIWFAGLGGLIRPGPGAPITRPDAGYVNWDGRYVYPPNR